VTLVGCYSPFFRFSGKVAYEEEMIDKTRGRIDGDRIESAKDFVDDLAGCPS
jgi:hypothetical protein